MENWWGNQFRRYAGHVMIDYVQKYKMTRGRQDGSTADDYSQSSTASDYAGYLTGATSPSTSDFAKKMKFDENGFQTSEVGGTSATYWCDYWYQDSGLRYAVRGGYCYNSTGAVGAFFGSLAGVPSGASWTVGAAPSCKPSATN